MISTPKPEQNELLYLPATPESIAACTIRSGKRGAKGFGINIKTI